MRGDLTPYGGKVARQSRDEWGAPYNPVMVSLSNHHRNKTCPL